jgi:hypothetical protein
MEIVLIRQYVCLHLSGISCCLRTRLQISPAELISGRLGLEHQYIQFWGVELALLQTSSEANCNETRVCLSNRAAPHATKYRNSNCYITLSYKAKSVCVYKVKLSPCVTNYALRHEGVRGSGCIDPQIFYLGTSRCVVSFTPRPL